MPGLQNRAKLLIIYSGNQLHCKSKFTIISFLYGEILRGKEFEGILRRGVHRSYLSMDITIWFYFSKIPFSSLILKVNYEKKRAMCLKLCTIDYFHQVICTLRSRNSVLLPHTLPLCLLYERIKIIS